MRPIDFFRNGVLFCEPMDDDVRTNAVHPSFDHAGGRGRRGPSVSRVFRKTSDGQDGWEQPQSSQTAGVGRR